MSAARALCAGALAGVAALQSAPACASDRPALELRCGVEAPNVWDSAGTGSAHPVTFYAAPADGPYLPVGATADGRSRGERAVHCLVRDISPRADALARPVDYERIWWDRGSSSLRDVALWRPRCPEGYVGVGIAAQASYRKPDAGALRCVRKDLTVGGAAAPLDSGPAQLGGAIYKDFGSRAFEDLSVWRVQAAQGFDASAVFAWGTRTMPQEKDGVRLLRKDRIQMTP